MNNNIGILDIKGENPNPLTNNPYSDEYKKLAKTWSKFPAYEKAEEIYAHKKTSSETRFSIFYFSRQAREFTFWL